MPALWRVWDRLDHPDLSMREVVDGLTGALASLPDSASRGQLLERLTAAATIKTDATSDRLRSVEVGAAMIKPNAHELEALTGSGTLDAARALHRRSGVTVLLTRGAGGAAYIGEELWEAQAPPVEVRNPVGSGDTLLGAFLQARVAGRNVPDALRLAVAAGSANAHLGGPAHFRAEVAHELAAQVRLRAPV